MNFVHPQYYLCQLMVWGRACVSVQKGNGWPFAAKAKLCAKGKLKGQKVDSHWANEQKQNVTLVSTMEVDRAESRKGK